MSARLINVCFLPVRRCRQRDRDLPETWVARVRPMAGARLVQVFGESRPEAIEQARVAFPELIVEVKP